MLQLRQDADDADDGIERWVSDTGYQYARKDGVTCTLDKFARVFPLFLIPQPCKRAFFAGACLVER